MIELDNDIQTQFTIFKNEYTVEPLKTATTDFSNLLTFLETPKVGTKNSNFGIVGGEVKESRNNKNTLSRSLLTVDIDDIPADVDLYSHLSARFYHLFAMYSTHNHSPENQRYRLLIPLDRAYTLTPEAYRAVIQHLCTEILDINYYDPASEVLSQIMYFPTTETPEHYEMYYQDEEVFQLSSILSEIEIPDPTNIPKKDNSHWIQILQGLHEGEGKGRDSTAASLLGHLLRRFVDPYVAYELLVCWNERNTPPLSEKDLERIFRSILSSEMKRRKEAGLLGKKE